MMTRSATWTRRTRDGRGASELPVVCKQARRPADQHDIDRREALPSMPERGLITNMYPCRSFGVRAALYVREGPGRRAAEHLERHAQWVVSGLARLDAQHVATYADCSLARPWQRPGLRRLLADAPWAFDLVVVDGYAQLAARRTDLRALSSQLADMGVGVVVVETSPGRRAARFAGNFALADLVASALR